MSIILKKNPTPTAFKLHVSWGEFKLLVNHHRSDCSWHQRIAIVLGQKVASQLDGAKAIELVPHDFIPWKRVTT